MSPDSNRSGGCFTSLSNTNKQLPVGTMHYWMNYIDIELLVAFGVPIIRIRSYIILFIVMIDHLWWSIDDHRVGE